MTASWRVRETSHLFFSYVRSSVRGDLNDFASFLGTFPVPLLRPNQFSYLPTDLPNRFLAWGNLKLPHGFQIAPVFEYRNGFPLGFKSKRSMSITCRELDPAFVRKSVWPSAETLSSRGNARLSRTIYRINR